MRILTPENKPFNLDYIPNEVDDIRYCVFDCSNKHDMDYYFLPLIFLESYTWPAVVLEIGDKSIQMPLDWSIMVCDEAYSNVEIMPLTKLNDRGFNTMAFNPLKHMVPVPVEVNITNVFADVKWYFPKLKNGNILIVPIEDCDTPRCVLFVKELAKIPDCLELADLFQ
jgi:hypothetical protein